MFNNFKRILNRLERIEENQNLILAKLEVSDSGRDGETADSASALLQAGIDSIMGYQWPPAKGGKE